MIMNYISNQLHGNTIKKFIITHNKNGCFLKAKILQNMIYQQELNEKR